MCVGKHTATGWIVQPACLTVCRHFWEKVNLGECLGEILQKSALNFVHKSWNLHRPPSVESLLLRTAWKTFLGLYFPPVLHRGWCLISSKLNNIWCPNLRSKPHVQCNPEEAGSSEVVKGMKPRLTTSKPCSESLAYLGDRMISLIGNSLFLEDTFSCPPAEVWYLCLSWGANPLQGVR